VHIIGRGGRVQTSDIHNLVKKIPLFTGLLPSQVRELFAEGEVQDFASGSVLCKEGEESRFLFILLRRQIAVQKEGETIAHIAPVEIVGEMGVITNSPRCATLVAEEETTVMTIAKSRFNYAIGMDAELAATIYKNVLTSSFAKLLTMNDHFIEHLSGGGFGLATSV
jgi:CRP-like cAMP-binding protein